MNQAIKFVIFAFQGHVMVTSLPSSNVVSYQMTERVFLDVVFENATGEYITYSFDLPQDATVFVVGDVIHVPVLCSTKKDGNTVTCADERP
jgi:hypothetical protein